MVKRGPSELYVLNPEQVRSVLANADTLEERLLIKGPLYLGLRVGELIHLQRDWVIPPKEIRIPASQWCACSSCLPNGGEWTPKTKSGARVIPLTDPIRDDVRAYLNQYPNGLDMTRQNAHRITKRILRRAGVKQGFPHALRATCATMLASAGLNAAQICYLMGWTSLDTAAHCIRVAAARKDASEAMERAFAR
jgi:integrase